MSTFWSTTKASAALCIAILVDRGVVKYDDLVTKHWPEFGKHGKRNVTIEMMLAHQAGMPCVDHELTTEIIGDRKQLCRILEDQKPQLPPGQHHAYHTLVHGYLISCLFPKIDPGKRTVGQFFKEEVADKFGIDFYIGLPKHLHYRCARIGENSIGLIGYMSMIITGLRMLGSDATLARRTFVEQTPPFLLKPIIANSFDVRSTEIAGGGGIGTARAQAKLYNLLLNGENNKGKSLVSSAVLKKAFVQITSGNDMNLGVAGFHTQFTRGGFYIGDLDSEHHGTLIGSPGYGMQAGYLRRDLNLTFAFNTNGMDRTSLLSDPRIENIVTAVYRSIEKLKQQK